MENQAPPSGTAPGEQEPAPDPGTSEQPPPRDPRPAAPAPRPAAPAPRQPPWNPPGRPRPGRTPPQLPPAVGPILRHHTWSGRLALPHMRIAHMLVHHNGDHEVIWPHTRQRDRPRTARVLPPQRPAVVYDIDLGQHQTTITANLHSADKGSFFHATLTVQWRVLDPSSVIRHLVTDIAEMLTPELMRRAQAITGTLPGTDFPAAQDKINETLGGPTIDPARPDNFQQALKDARASNSLGAEYGLWTRVIAQLEPDEAAAGHLKTLTELNRQMAEEQARHKLRKLQEQHTQEITLDRVDLYREIIATGDIERFALQLAGNPGDVATLHTIIREELQASRRDTIDFVTHMVESGVIERWEVSDQVKETLRFIQAMSARIIQAGGHAREEPPEVPAYRRRRQDRTIPGKVASSDDTATEP